jgi:hypothetical protein
MHLQEGPVEIRTPTNWNLICRSMAALPSVLSPSSTLPPRSSHCAFISVRKYSTGLSKMLSLQLFYFLKNLKSEDA